MIVSRLTWVEAMEKFILFRFGRINKLEVDVLKQVVLMTYKDGTVLINEEAKGKVAEVLGSSVPSVANSVSRLSKMGAIKSMGSAHYSIVDFSLYPPKHLSWLEVSLKYIYVG